MNRMTLLAGGVFALSAATASATDHVVTAFTSPNRFEPAEITIAVGDTVTFMNGGGFHNVASDTDSVTAFRCANGCDGDGGDGDPSSASWSATVAFPTAGTAAFHCEVHGSDGGGGMAGTITIEGGGGAPVVDVQPAALEGAAETGALATVPFTIGNTGDADLVWTADTASTSCATPDTVTWLSVNPTGGTVVAGDPAADVAATLDAATLAPGVYNANVCVHSNDAAHDPVTLPVSFTVSVPDLIFGNGFDPEA